MKIKLLLGIAVELILIYNFSSRIISLSETQKRIDTARAERDSLAVKYASRSAELAYVQTDSYVEEIARKKLFYGHAQDHLLIIPSDSDLRVDLPAVEHKDTAVGADGLGGYFVKWFDLFFRS